MTKRPEKLLEQAELNEERRRQILKAAQRCCAKHGIQHATLKSIAQDAGISVGHIYNHFKNKDMLVEGMVALETEELIRLLGPDNFSKEKDQASLDKRLAVFVDAYMKVSSAQISISIMNEATTNPKVRKILTNASMRLSQHVMETTYRVNENVHIAPEVLEARILTVRAFLEGLRCIVLFSPRSVRKEIRVQAIRRLRNCILDDRQS